MLPKMKNSLEKIKNWAQMGRSVHLNPGQQRIAKLER